MRALAFAALTTAAFAVSTNCLAQATQNGSSEPKKVVAKPCSDKNASDVDCIALARYGAPDPFRGLHWGLGISYNSSLGGIGKVEKDSSNVVRVRRENSSAARGAFELHYFFKYCGNFASYSDFPEGKNPGWGIYLPTKNVNGRYECYTATEFGMGPFLSLNTSPFDNLGENGGKVFDSLGVGWMLGFNAYSGNDEIKHSLNIGAGLILDTNVKELALGVRDGQTTTVDQLTRETTKTGFMVMLSYKLFNINID